MNNEKFKFNKIEIAGEIVKELQYDHESRGEKFYQLTVCCRRLSENYDDIPVLISGKIIDTNQKYLGKYIHITGQIRSFLKYGDKEGNKASLQLNVFALDYELSDDDIFGSINDVYLDGHTCKETYYKETPSGFEITEMLVCINRSNSIRCDYIPCICWSRNARWADGFELGTHVTIHGRMQSRYVKNKCKTVYEASVFNMSVYEQLEGFENETEKNKN